MMMPWRYGFKYSNRIMSEKLQEYLKEIVRYRAKDAEMLKTA